MARQLRFGTSFALLRHLHDQFASARTRHCGPGSLVSRQPLRRRRKAAVLPVPVWLA
jgi:hypothetical protein